jgi:hypothetical protein
MKVSTELLRVLAYSFLFFAITDNLHIGRDRGLLRSHLVGMAISLYAVYHPLPTSVRVASHKPSIMNRVPALTFVRTTAENAEKVCHPAAAENPQQ